MLVTIIFVSNGGGWYIEKVKDTEYGLFILTLPSTKDLKSLIDDFSNSPTFKPHHSAMPSPKIYILKEAPV